jgi:hypothetical protein
VFTDEDDMDWPKREISDIKECMKEMAEHLRGNVEYRLERASFGYPRIILSPSSLYISTS